MGVAAAYDGYLKAATFEKPPEIGERWPRDGYYLPTREAFMREFERRASANIIGYSRRSRKQGIHIWYSLLEQTRLLEDSKDSSLPQH